MRQHHRVAEQRDHVLNQRKALTEQSHRPGRSLASRARQLVVKFGIFEERQIEAQRLVQNLYVYIRAEARAQERAHEALATLRRGGQRDEQQLERDPMQGQRPAVLHYGVDDALAGEGNRQRQRRSRHTQSGHVDQERRRGSPNQAQRAAGMAK
jgi:hypothetical protein